MNEKITTSDVHLALRRTYCAPEWALLFEVGDATGGRHSRFADAVAMSLWPSRGLTLTGMEVKVSRSDWMRERAKPQKAETIAAYCDYWQLVTAPRVVLDETEIPPAWGWLEFDGKRFVTRKKPEKTEAKGIDRGFLAALLRRAHNADEGVLHAMVKERTKDLEERFEMRVEDAARNRTRHRDEALKLIEEFEKETGLSLSERDWMRPSGAELGRAINAVLKSGIDNSYSGMRQLSAQLREAAGKIDGSMAAVGLELPLAEIDPKIAGLNRHLKRSA